MTPLTLLLLKTLLIFAGFGLSLLALRRASAAARHLVCLLTLAALLALPGLSLALPGWQMLPAWMPPVVSAPVGPPAPSLGSLKEEAQSPGVSPTLIPAPQNWGGGTSASSSSRFGRTPVSAANKEVGPFWPLAVIVLYTFGVLLALTRPMLGFWGIRQLSRHSILISDAPTQALAADCAAALRLSRRPALRQAAVPVPMTWGSRRPTILLPQEFENWPQDRLRAVLLHELAHIRRQDWLGHRLADITCAGYWFHPLVWLTARRLRAESEAACDDLVLASGIAAPDYARHLLEIARALPPLSVLPQAAIAMAQTSQVESRLQMILDKTRNRQALTNRALRITLGLSMVAVMSLAMLRPAAKAQKVSVTAIEAPSVQLMGVKDVNVYHTGHLWWKSDGRLLPPSAADAGAFQIDKDLFSSTDVKNLSFDLRLPANIDSETVKLIPTGSLVFAQQKVQRNENSHSRWTLTSSFPLTLKTTTLSVGVGAGPWTEVVDCPRKAGKVRLKRPSGEVIFTLIANPHGLTSAKEIYETCDLTSVSVAPGNAILIVSDHFHNPSPLKVDKMAVMISSYASRTRSGEAVQKIRHDAENCERVVYGLDRSGRVITKLTGTMNLNLEDEQNDRFKMDQLISIPPSLLKRIAAFRLVARPYQWTEFKNVALQPVQ